MHWETQKYEKIGGPKIFEGSNGRTIWLGKIGKYLLSGRDCGIQSHIYSFYL